MLKKLGLLKNTPNQEMYSLKELVKVQEQIKQKIILKDVLPKKITTVAGVDQSFPQKDKIISAIVVCNYPSMRVIEKKHAAMKVDFPYIPGFLSFREGPSIIKAFSRLKNKPDILLADGNGILHFRGVGIASHIGVLLDVATIGVAKSLLCGEYEEPKRVGKSSPVIYEDRTIGYAYKSKKNCNPIFISPGHKVSMKTSLEIVKASIGKYKLPITLRLAHIHADELKRKYVYQDIKTKKVKNRK